MRFLSTSIALALISCGGCDATESFPTPASDAGPHTGDFHLRTIDGVPPPYVIERSEDGETGFTGGKLQIFPSGRYTETYGSYCISNSIFAPCSAPRLTASGNYHRTGDRFDFRPYSGPDYTGSLHRGDTLSITDPDGRQVLYTREECHPFYGSPLCE